MKDIGKRSPAIIGFAKDWDDVPTCFCHVLRQIAKKHPVLWVESVGTRMINLTRRDISRILRRILNFGNIFHDTVSGIDVISPVVLPPLLRERFYFNRFLFDLQINKWKRVYGGKFEYWCSIPTAVDFIGRNELESVVVYYCVDDWHEFEGLDRDLLALKEEELLKKADVVFTPSRFLTDRIKSFLEIHHRNIEVFYIPHGVNFELFSKALDKELPCPDDIRHLPHPVIGFYGNIKEWVDFDLVVQLATERPQWSFVFIGPVYRDVSFLRKFPNIYLLGRREYDLLPSYCKAFDVGIIPYDTRISRMKSVAPVKTREMLSAGVPVAASKLPELNGLDEAVKICHSIDSWLSTIESLLKMDRYDISIRQKEHSWGKKVAMMRSIVDEIWNKKVDK